MHLAHKVTLELHEDAGYGLTGVNSKYIFDPFWSGIGIFHDIFEHWFEGTHKHFLNPAAFNILGEVSAMGAANYFASQMCVPKRKTETFQDFEEASIQTIDTLMYDLLCSESRFGNILYTELPYQPPIEDEVAHCSACPEGTIEKLWEVICSLVEGMRTEGNEEEVASITKSVIRDSFRWGYRMARRLIPDTYHNRDVLNDFIERWDSFCKQNNPEDFLWGDKEYPNRYLTVRMYKDDGDIKITEKWSPWQK